METLTAKPAITRDTKKLVAMQKIQSVALKAIHDFFEREGFLQLMPIMLSPITDPLGPDPGSSVLKTGEIEYLGQKLQLTQSMILHKQIAIGLGLEKFYIMSPNIRLEAAERRATGKHAFEFTQVDFEIKGATMSDVFKLVEGLLKAIVDDVKIRAVEELELLNREIPKWRFPFRQVTTHELEDQYGSDWESSASLDTDTPFWAICHDREFYDKKDYSREGEHFLNYDLIYPEGFGEALSGAEREHEYDRLMQRITEDKLDPKKYASYLALAKEDRLSPSAGGGLGVERLVRYLTGSKHVGDVQVFRRVPGETLLY